MSDDLTSPKDVAASAPSDGGGASALDDTPVIAPTLSGALSVPGAPVDKPDLPSADRDKRGRFAKGNRANKVAKRGGYNVSKQAKLRAAILECVTTERLATMVGSLLTKACAGDVHAARLIMEYSLGKPLPGDILERIARIETAMELDSDLDPEVIAAESRGVPRTKLAAALYASVEAHGETVDNRLAALDEPEQDSNGEDQ